ncbi:hypothetical protein D3C80_1521400 [compost metagenome]
MHRIGGNAAPVHSTQRAREAQRQIRAGRRVEPVIAHFLEVDAAQQLVVRRGAPHVRLGQLLGADLRHAHRFWLGRRVGLVGNVARFDRDFFDPGQRFTGGAVEDEDLPGLGADYQCRNRLTVGLGKVDQARLHRQVEVPEVVVHGLVHPFLFTAAGVQGQH